MRRLQAQFVFLFLIATYSQVLLAADLDALPEFLRSDPFGAIVAPDRSGADLASSLYGAKHQVVLTGCRGGYVSFHLVVKPPSPSTFTLDVTIPDPTNKVQIDLFREWFHFTDSDKRYYPDALIPVHATYSSRLPEPDNRIPKQTAQAFWVDVYVAPDTRLGIFSGTAKLKANSKITTLPIQLTVLACVIPGEDVVTIDHNSYGSSWLAQQFAGSYQRNSDDWFESNQFFELIHAYHRVFYEHRGIFHQLGYGHSGKVGPEFAPVLEGAGRAKHTTSWGLYDRHYGPLFDGTAFSASRRGPRPIPFVYLPINPEWPASYEFWGERGYEAEFVNVVSEMERHFREKGWTHTNFEVFFNHKKRYKGFPWDGDEVRFPKDLKYFIEYGRLLKEALPADTPVHFLFRADVSWDMEQQFRVLNGVVKLWCAGGGILSLYKDVPEMLRNRGDVIWYYGGPPSVTDSSTAITEFSLRAWLWGVNGYVHWLTVSPGEDPWFHFDGGQTALIYSGERFGVREPIPSIRLKIQRNCLQDLALLDSLKRRKSLDSLRARAARSYNNSVLDDWWNSRPALADLPSDQWLGSAIDDATKHTQQALGHPGASAWYKVHQYAMSLQAEAK
ncbi:MAG: hypothetical protein AUF67_16655 [Acidobacteria bacterium 13_1_20CM_58_21]|nr:MAG: hypothetical protein AUF67_16655 [Acidobacteria bacterium 13_1_20CM_58_21]